MIFHDKQPSIGHYITREIPQNYYILCLCIKFDPSKAPVISRKTMINEPLSRFLRFAMKMLRKSTINNQQMVGFDGNDFDGTIRKK